MASLFDKTKGMEDIAEILSRMEVNIPDPSSNSGSLWKLRQATGIGSHNRSCETMLEKAVAMLAENGHMPGWFNQCPTASGIGDSSRNRRSNVDLVHWSRSGMRARLVELKWDCDSPSKASEAVRQILRYGAAYLFCRMHRNRLRVRRGSVMDACDISLQVAAPAHYYTDSGLRYCLSRARENLARFDIGSRIDGLSMSVDVLALPEWFDSLPFAKGEEVRAECDTDELTEAGRKVCDAFDGLTSVYPEADGGRHPVLDCLVTTPSAVVGIESKRFEPFRGRKESALSDAYWRPVWIATVCGQLETRYRYSNTLGWNTFPVPALTEKNKADLTRCAEDILLAREAHFPATIADLYDAERMPENLRAAHDRNDDVLERIYIGRRFRNDTERLEKLFEMYAKMAGNQQFSFWDSVSQRKGLRGVLDHQPPARNHPRESISTRIACLLGAEFAHHGPAQPFSVARSPIVP